MLKLQNFKSQLIENDPDAEKDWGRQEKGQQRILWLDGIADSVDGFEQILGCSEGQEASCAAVPGVEKSWTWLSNWKQQPQQHVLFLKFK